MQEETTEEEQGPKADLKPAWETVAENIFDSLGEMDQNQLVELAPETSAKPKEHFEGLARRVAAAAARIHEERREPIPSLVQSALKAGQHGPVEGADTERAPGGQIKEQKRLRSTTQSASKGRRNHSAASVIASVAEPAEPSV